MSVSDTQLVEVNQWLADRAGVALNLTDGKSLPDVSSSSANLLLFAIGLMMILPIALTKDTREFSND